FFFDCARERCVLPYFPTRRSSDLDAQREFAQHVITGIVTVAVVDRLEIVDVKHQHRDWLFMGGSLLDQRPQVRLHVAPVEKAREDRKSTRLNSSHQIISYAVFCLK